MPFSFIVCHNLSYFIILSLHLSNDIVLFYSNYRGKIGLLVVFVYEHYRNRGGKKE